MSSAVVGAPPAPARRRLSLSDVAALASPGILGKRPRATQGPEEGLEGGEGSPRSTTPPPLSDDHHRTELPTPERLHLVAVVAHHINPDTKRMQRGTWPKVMSDLAARGLDVSTRTAARISKKWRDHAASVTATPASVGRERRGRTGRPPRLTAELGKRIIELQDEHHGKASERKLCGLQAEEKHQVAPSTMHHWCKAMGMHVFKRPLQPSLTLNHKIQRLKFVLGQLERAEGGEYKFPGWNQHVHVGEKWFFLKQDKQAIRLFPCPDGTNEPPRDSVPHKSQMPKVMFLSAIAMPRPEYGFNGKLGLWPFVCERLAGRSHAATGTVKGQTMILDDVPVNAATYQEIITCEGGVMDMIAQRWGGS